MTPTNPLSSAERQDILWSSLRERLARAEVSGVRANKLGPIAALNLRQQGRPVPPALETDARHARAAWMGAIPLLSRIRSACDGPLLLIKGPEVAARYPGRARSFKDLDILTPDAEAVHAALRAHGFVEVDDPEVYERDQHHLRPLQWPALWMWVEIHSRPLWPTELHPPPVADIIAAAVPSATGVPGISAPHPAHHAIILASHGWGGQPLKRLRDLVDVAAVAAQTDEEMIAAVAREWGIGRIWRTMYGAANGLLGRRGKTLAVRLWGRHLPEVREYRLLDNHLQRWLNGFWGLPPQPALRWIVAVFRQELFPYPNESWRDKLIRVRQALTQPRAAMSSHIESWEEAAGLPPRDPGRDKRRRS